MSLLNQGLECDAVLIKLFCLVVCLSVDPWSVANIPRFFFRVIDWVVAIWHLKRTWSNNRVVEALWQLRVSLIVRLIDWWPLRNQVPQLLFLFTSEQAFSLLIFGILIHFQKVRRIYVFAFLLYVHGEFSQDIRTNVILKLLLLVGCRNRSCRFVLTQCSGIASSWMIRWSHWRWDGWFFSCVLTPITHAYAWF